MLVILDNNRSAPQLRLPHPLHDKQHLHCTRHNIPTPKLPVPLLLPFHRVNHIAIQSDFPLAAWSCGTITILTTLHLTLGHIRPDNINTGNIDRRNILIFNQALLQWLILDTSPNLWNLNCINKDIIRGELILFPEAHARCGFM